MSLHHLLEHFAAESSVVHLYVIQFLLPKPPQVLEADEDLKG